MCLCVNVMPGYWFENSKVIHSVLIVHASKVVSTPLEICICYKYKIIYISIDQVAYTIFTPSPLIHNSEHGMWFHSQWFRLPAMQETRVWSLGQKGPLENGMATHSSMSAWRIPWTEEPSVLQSMGSQRVRQNWVTNTFLYPNICPISEVVL